GARDRVSGLLRRRPRPADRFHPRRTVTSLLWFLPWKKSQASAWPDASCAQGKDRVIERNEHHADDDGDDQQQRRLDQRHRGRQRGLHIFLIKFRDRVEHRGKSARALSHFNHFHCERREVLGFLQALREGTSLPYFMRTGKDR